MTPLGYASSPFTRGPSRCGGEKGYPTLAQVPDGTVVTVVDFFVNSSRVGAVVDEAIVNKDRLGIETLWLQLGVIDQDGAQRAVTA
jgi:hypothetical protein